jgi:hypothetical protein
LQIDFSLEINKISKKSAAKIKDIKNDKVDKTIYMVDKMIFIPLSVYFPPLELYQEYLLTYIKTMN